MLHSWNALSNRKVFLYSAHDTTLIPCLLALGIFDMRWPPYAADLTMELHQNRKTNEAFVKVSYVGEVGAENVSQDEQKQKKNCIFFFSFYNLKLLFLSAGSTHWGL